VTRSTRRVVALVGSRRKRNTHQVVRQVSELLAQDGVEVEPHRITEFSIEHCNGCERCLRGGDCPIRDDQGRLERLLCDADGLILASPVYMDGPSSRLKTFIDRTCRWFHRPPLVGKPVLVIATSAASGVKATTAYLQDVGIKWGMQPAGRIGRTVRTLERPVSPREVASFARHLRLEPARYRPRLRQILMFQVQKVLAEKVLTVDREFWRARGWLDRVYYDGVRVPPHLWLVGRSFHALLHARVRKVEDEPPSSE